MFCQIFLCILMPLSQCPFVEKSTVSQITSWDPSNAQGTKSLSPRLKGEEVKIASSHSNKRSNPSTKHHVNESALLSPSSMSLCLWAREAASQMRFSVGVDRKQPVVQLCSTLVNKCLHCACEAT